MDNTSSVARFRKCKTWINHNPMNKETQVTIQLLTENDLTEAMQLIEPANWNHFHTGFGIQSAVLLKRSFAKQRDLIRMRYGQESNAGASTMVFAIAGPDIG